MADVVSIKQKTADVCDKDSSPDAMCDVKEEIDIGHTIMQPTDLRYQMKLEPVKEEPTDFTMADVVSIKQKPADVCDEDSSPDAMCDVKEEIDICHTIQPIDLRYQIKLEPVKEESTSIRIDVCNNDNTQVNTNQKTLLKKTSKQIKPYRDHMGTPRGELLHSRKHCEMSFTSRSTLRSHMTHECERPHACEICGKLFIRKVHLSYHMMSHTGERPHTCEICGKSFTIKGNLNSHMMTHTGERPHTCGICEKSFIRKTHLNYHMMSHTGKRLHRCEICKKLFTIKSNLNSHMMTHTGERPHTCEVCEKSFTFKSSLHSHMTTHTGERLYTCKICEKLFTMKSNLNSHMMTHTGERPHTCGICEKSYENLI